MRTERNGDTVPSVQRAEGGTGLWMLCLSGVVVSARARGERAGVTRTALPVGRRGPIVGTLAAHWLPAAAGPRSPPADTKRVQDGGGGRGEPARRGRGAAGAARGAGAEPAPPPPLPRRQPGRDAAAALLEPQGQVQLHRPLAGQPARPLQRYMGIGLSAQGVNMNRLPGWDKHSYGYHGDDGHSFCSSGTGQPYGPTFTTGDVIGCCVNLINNTCFYTKNGHSLGIAFTDLPSNLYPTVGLQTPGEIVDANFGQQPFVFDIEDYMREWRAKIQSTIKRFPIGDRLGEWQAMLQNMVSSYLVHHGYCSTATAFARVTDTTIQEEQTSIKNRQRIQKLVLAGRVGEAIEATQQLYPGLLEHNPNLLFMLKCRQFVEMVNGTDSEVRCFSARSPRSQDSYPGSPSLSPRHGSSNSHLHSTGADSPTCSNGVMSTKSKQSHSKYPTLSSSSSSSSSSSPSSVNYSESNSTDSTKSQQHSSTSNQETSDSEMEMEAEHYPNGVLENSSTRIMNGTYKHEEILQTDESSMDSCPQRQLCGGNHAATERMIQFGRELQILSEQLCREYGKNTMHKKMLQDAFSLLAYSDPWNCPVGQQLDPIQREPVCAALNSAILESQNLPKQPPLMLALGQASECLRLMARVGLGSCSFARVDDYLH
ncbi:ran-binding protein 10 isoform X2 [Poecile atricapillus]|uniref:ran-binding protein 10 isoform X2 n=2 Tax=Passeriformes TaxID=9126 RepID=UPI002738AC71|nr:ran-binding protein 10 isoform X2 [Poecile atricapillus]